MTVEVDNLKNAVGKRLREAREALGLTQKDFCERIGMPLPTLRGQELCKRIPGGEAINSFTGIGISADWLLTGKGDMFLSKAVPADEPTPVEYGSNHKSSKGLRVHESPRATYSTDDPEDGYVTIPLYDDVSAAAGHGAIAGMELPTSTALMFREEWVRTELDAKPSDLCLINVRGHSMEPTLKAGDVILIDLRANSIDCEGVYLLRIGESLLVKNLQVLPGARIRVTSDNPTFEPFTINVAEIENEIAILGRVVWGGRRF